MPFDYAARVANVNNALTDHNTTTAAPDLSADMTTRVRNIFTDDPDVTGVKLNELPAVFIRISDSVEDNESIGPRGGTAAGRVNINKEVTYHLIGLYHKDGLRTSHASLMTELYRFAENVEGVLQTEHKLSNTAQWIVPETTEFLTAVGGDGTRISGFQVTAVAKYLFR